MGFASFQRKIWCLTALVCFSLFSSTAPSRAEATVAAPASADPQPGETESGEAALLEGDKVKLVFYERLDNEDDRWKGQRGGVPRGFHQRNELSGEYIVENGHVTIPMIGRFKVSGASQDAVLASLKRAFEDLIDRKGYVSLVGVEHPPIYIVGPVKNPGSFKYEARMTVLHAVALAGGVREQVAETWQRVEFGREVERLQRFLDKSKRLMARTVVMQAERDGADVRQDDVARIVGKAQASSLVADEAWQRKLTVMSRNAQAGTLTAAVDNARVEVKDRAGRLAPLDAAIAMRAERVKNLEDLAQRNLVSRPVVIQAQAELNETHDRRNQALVENEAARTRLDAAERELSRFRIETRSETARTATTTRQDTIEVLDEGQGGLDAIKALAAYKQGANADGRMVFEIVRRTPSGTLVLTVPDTATLMPGDLVRLKVADEVTPPAPGTKTTPLAVPRAAAQSSG